jgi:hypothetical protein
MRNVVETRCVRGVGGGIEIRDRSGRGVYQRRAIGLCGQVQAVARNRQTVTQPVRAISRCVRIIELYGIISCQQFAEIALPLREARNISDCIRKSIPLLEPLVVGEKECPVSYLVEQLRYGNRAAEIAAKLVSAQGRFAEQPQRFVVGIARIEDVVLDKFEGFPVVAEVPDLVETRRADMSCPFDALKSATAILAS